MGPERARAYADRPDNEPSVAVLLDVDVEYRRKAAAGLLATRPAVSTGRARRGSRSSIRSVETGGSRCSIRTPRWPVSSGARGIGS